MYISELLIMNYRSIEKEKINFKPGKNVLVGKNNSGKSNIVKALDLVLGEKNPVYRDVNDKDFFTFYNDNKEQTKDSFFISVKLEGNDINEKLFRGIKGLWLTPVGEENLIEYCYNNKRYTKVLIGNVDDLTNKKYYKDVGELFRMFNNAQELYIYFTVAKKESFLDSSIIYMDNEQDNYQKTYAILLKYNNKYFRCSRISNDLKNSLITSAILPAVRDINKELRINSWSWYGKLIKDIWDNCDSGKREEIDKKLEEIKSITDDIFISASSDIKEKIKKAIYHNSISFQLLQNTKDDIYKGINIFINDGIEGLLEDKGTGIQSAVIIALFSYYCSKFHMNSSLLVVEEPEIYLHPQARRVLSNKFDEFVNLNSQNKNQVIVTTHSSEFIRNTDIWNIVIVKKVNGKSETRRININKENNKELAKLQNIISTKNAEIFFADKVILVEGAEEYLIPLIADHYHNEKGYLDNNNISVAKVGGKSFFKQYIELLSYLDIEYFVIADFDILHHGLENISEYIHNFSQEELNSIRKSLKEIIPENEPWAKSRKIKDKILKPDNSIDARTLCEIIDSMSSTEKYDKRLKEVWEYLRPKVTKKVSYIILNSHPEVKEKVFGYIDKLKQDNIYVLKKGELEDYITSEGLEIIEDLGLANQKELKVIKIAELINSEEIGIEQVLDVGDYMDVIKRL
ncbi:ATP-dependent nuclease [Garciella nitratireducens]|uniref:ATP-dependent nuclease n=1 Tax=Garciella nitratireducens TaxID=218205 RepID=UPI001BD2E05D|nr:ATP-dependent endonuclease [Garciella nitratireducens]